jgi:hypothetical protein
MTPDGSRAKERTLRAIPWLLPWLLSGLLPACSAYYNHHFAPAPVEVDLYVDGEPDSQARGLVTVNGIRRPDDGRGAVVEVRLRIENLGANPAQLVTESLALVSADLREMGSARVAPEPAPIERGAVGLYDVAFELPAGQTPSDYDLDGLNLKWEVDFGDKRVMSGITFERIFGPYDYDSHVSFGFGYVHTD